MPSRTGAESSLKMTKKKKKRGTRFLKRKKKLKPKSDFPAEHLGRTHLECPARLPRGCGGKESTCQCRRLRRWGFDPSVRKIPWSRIWQPTPVFLSEESHGQRSLAGYSLWGSKELGTSEQLNTHSGPGHHTCYALTLAQTQCRGLSNTELN